MSNTDKTPPRRDHRRAPVRRTERVAVLMTPTEYDHVAILAAERGMPMAALLREAAEQAGILPARGGR